MKNAQPPTQRAGGDTRREAASDSPSTGFERWKSVPGYTVIRQLGRGGIGEVYEVEAPGGFAKAIKLVPLDPNNPLSQREQHSLTLIRSIRHPFLLSIDRVDIHDDHLTILMELADHSLADECQRMKAVGLPGIPRPRLLSLLAEAAEALDLLNRSYNIQHLDVKPANLFVTAGHVKVGDFGLSRKMDGRILERRLNAISPCYAAPELFEGGVSHSSDQYSLAIVYMELLAGTFPYRGNDAAQIAFQLLKGGPCLEGLHPEDQPIIAKALSHDPRARYGSCLELVRALQRNGAGDASNSGNRRKAIFRPAHRGAPLQQTASPRMLRDYKRLSLPSVSRVLPPAPSPPQDAPEPKS